MQIGVTPPPISPGFADAALVRTGLAQDQSEFARILSMTAPGRRSMTGGTPTPPGDADDRARDAAEQLVATVLVEPILKLVRESNQGAPPFAPSNGEKQFRSMIDAKLAHEITGAARFPLVDRLARDLRSHLRTEAQTTPAVRA